VPGMGYSDAAETSVMSETLDAGTRLSNSVVSQGDDLVVAAPMYRFSLYAYYLLKGAHLLSMKGA